MFSRLSGTLLAVLLGATLLWGRCPVCPFVLSVQDSPHDCCQRSGAGHCGTPGSQQPGGKKCPNQSYALESYARVELEARRAPEFLPSVSSLEPLPERGPVVPPSSDLPLVHAPPDLYLLNSILLI